MRGATGDATGAGRPLRIMHVTTSFHYGGLERQVIHLANGMGRRGHRVTVCTTTSEGGAQRAMLDKGVAITHFGGAFWRHNVTGHLRMAQLLLRHRPHVLHLHTRATLGAWAGWLARTPVIVRHEHGKNLYKSERVLKRDGRADGVIDMRIAVSEDIRQLRITREGTPPEKIQVIPNAVAPAEPWAALTERAGRYRDAVMPSGEGLVLGTVGRFVEAKAFDQLVNALYLVARRGHRFRFVFIGDGETRPRIESMVRSCGLSGRVRFVGFHSDVPALLSMLDGFVISSVREGLPVAMLEAMMHSVPVIATAVGGIPEVIRDGRNGLLVAPGDTESMARTLSRFLSLPLVRRLELAGAGRAHAERHYSTEAMVASVLGLYQGIYERKTRWKGAARPGASNGRTSPWAD